MYNGLSLSPLIEDTLILSAPMSDKDHLTGWNLTQVINILLEHQIKQLYRKLRFGETKIYV